MTTLPNVYLIPGHGGTAPSFNKSFVAGCPGSKLITDGVLRDGPVAMFGEHSWWKTLAKVRAEGRTWYYGDHAYFGRNHYYRITKNALQVSGTDFDKNPEANAARLAEVSAYVKKHKITDGIQIYEKPQWNPDGFILVCPPTTWLSERSGFTQQEWIDQTVATLKTVTDRPLKIREKPKGPNRNPAPLLAAMKGARCAVTYTSNVATEVMLGGFPCITTGPHPANVFGNTSLYDVAKPYLPSPATLRSWAGWLCRNQWTAAEIQRGDAWKVIQ